MILELIKTITIKIYEEPFLVALLFEESSHGHKKGNFLTMHILI